MNSRKLGQKPEKVIRFEKNYVGQKSSKIAIDLASCSLGIFGGTHFEKH
jgi:hypothetical protein